MKFVGQFYLMRINYGKWKSEAAKKLRQSTNDAAVVWINAAIIGTIPVWGGASWGTAKRLARAVNYSFSIPYNAFGHPLAKGPQVGFRESYGKVNRNFNDLQYSFTYATSLWHLVYNEYMNANANKKAGRVFSELKIPGPYNFQQIGADAFNDYVQNVRLPNPWDHLKLTPKRVGI